MSDNIDNFIKQIKKQQLMSTKRFYREYSRNGYIHKINPEFQGIAHKYYNQKKEFQKIDKIKKELDVKATYLQRLDQKMEKHLSKKKIELKYVQSLRSRTIDDLKRREWLEQFKKQQIEKRKQMAGHVRSQSQQNITSAKASLIQRKKSIAQQNRTDHKNAIHQKFILHARQQDLSRSKVNQIKRQKLVMKYSQDKFHQSRNLAALKSYQTTIIKQKLLKTNDQQKIKELQDKLARLNSSCENRKKVIDQINQEIERTKKEQELETSMIRSRLRSSSSSQSLQRKQNSQGTTM